MKKRNTGMICLLILLALFMAGALLWVVKGQARWNSVEASHRGKIEKISIEGNIQQALVAEDETTSEMTGEESQPSSPPSGILFAGDVLLSNHVTNAYDRVGGIHGVLSDEVRNIIGQSGFFVVNQEFPFSDKGVAEQDKQYTFRLPKERVVILKEMGIDLVTLANNHTLDFGVEALLECLEILDGAAIQRIGAGREIEEAKAMVTAEISGKTVGFLGASRVLPSGEWFAGTNRAGILSTYEPSVLTGEIKKAKETCDYVVVYVHWGIEKNDTPEDYQRTLGKQYIDAGADLVIGSHPHVLQGIEYYQGKPIVYSLGNFVFGSSIPKTALLKVDIGGENPVLTLYPLTSAGGYTSAIEGEEKKQEFYRYIEGLSFDVTIDSQGQVSSQSIP